MSEAQAYVVGVLLLLVPIALVALVCRACGRAVRVAGHRGIERAALRLHGAATFLPVAWFAFFFTLVLHARLWLGHWPLPRQYDSALLPPYVAGDPIPPVHGILVGLVTVAIVGLTWVYPGLEVLRRTLRPRSSWLQPMLFSVGIVGFWVFAFADPGGTFDWFMGD